VAIRANAGMERAAGREDKVPERQFRSGELPIRTWSFVDTVMHRDAVCENCGQRLGRHRVGDNSCPIDPGNDDPLEVL
jgi:hypothetical protein